MPGRHSPSDAEAVLRKLLPDPSQRARVTAYLREIWAHVHSRWPEKCGLTLFDKELRLNLGMIEVFVLRKGEVSVVLDKGRTGSGVHGNYGSVPDGLFRTYAVSGFLLDLPKLRARHFALMEKAGRTRKHPTALNAHSPGVVEYLETLNTARHFLYYWKLATVEANAGASFEHIAGNQLRRVRPGNVVWVVTISGGRLHLFLRFRVGEVVGQAEAQRRLKTGNLWESEVHLLSPNLDPQEAHWVDIHDLAPDLRFQGEVDRLPTGFNSQNLQALRYLAAASWPLLQEAWSGAGGQNTDRQQGETTTAVREEEPSDGEAEAFPEGRAVYVRHVKRERSAALVRRKKAWFLQNHGHLFCEACGFDYEAAYGSLLGAGFMECHHLLPLACLPPGSSTRLEDLALVCSNCHRMLHRARPWVAREMLNSLIVDNEKTDRNMKPA